MERYVVSMTDDKGVTKNKLYRVIKESKRNVTIVNDNCLEQDIIVDSIKFMYMNILF